MKYIGIFSFSQVIFDESLAKQIVWRGVFLSHFNIESRVEWTFYNSEWTQNDIIRMLIQRGITPPLLINHA